jgi:4-hydroxybenzoate polyprenyltransferase
MIHFIRKYIGWRNWSVLTHNSVFENIFLLFYIALADRLFSPAYMEDFFLFLAFSVFSTTYGYLVNDLADKELDSLHGKKNTFDSDSTPRAFCIVLLFLILSIVVGVHFLRNPLFLPLWVCWGMVATFYSVRPVRLKERGKAGLFFVVCAQRILPAVLIFAAFNHYALIDVIIFTAYIFFRGLSSDLNHQLEDYINDSGTGTRTYAVTAGIQKARRVFRFSLEAEKSLFIVCLVVMLLKIREFEVYGIPLLLPVLFMYLVLYALNLFEMTSKGAAVDVNPFARGKKNIFQFMHHAFPSVVLPFFLVTMLVFREWVFLPIFVMFVVLKRMYSPSLILNSFPVRNIRNMVAR